MAEPLYELVQCWMAWGGIDPGLAPAPECAGGRLRQTAEPTRPGADPREVATGKSATAIACLQDCEPG